jgi:hypothetical protein
MIAHRLAEPLDLGELLSIYSDAKADDLRAASATLFG